jgi:hypothetical protein
MLRVVSMTPVRLRRSSPIRDSVTTDSEPFDRLRARPEFIEGANGQVIDVSFAAPVRGEALEPSRGEALEP